MQKKYKKILTFLGATILFIALFVLWFNRVPERTIPKDPHLIVSPANGKVIAILHEEDAILDFVKKGIENEMYIPKIQPPYQAVVIEMNIWNVHAQRSPLTGVVEDKRFVPGKFANAVFSNEKEYLARENEKMIHIIGNESIRVGVIQVAGILARRIQSFVEPGDSLKKGEVFGRILLGSQVVVILPEEIPLKTKVGDIVIDGESVIAEIPATIPRGIQEIPLSNKQQNAYVQ